MTEHVQKFSRPIENYRTRHHLPVRRLPNGDEFDAQIHHSFRRGEGNQGRAIYESDRPRKVEFEYAELSALKAKIPPPPPREEFVIVKGKDNLEVTINAPLRQIYQSLISVDERINWEAVDKIEREPVTGRIGMRHHCQVEGMTLENTVLYSEFKGAAAIYVERTASKEINLDVTQVFDMKALADNITQLNININWQQTQLPSEMKSGLLQKMKESLESFKRYCESKTPDD